MNNVTMAIDAADAGAIDAIEQHHAELAGGVAHRVAALVRAAAAGDAPSAEAAQRDLVSWCRAELVPHAEAEESTLYPPAHATTEGRLLVTAMIEEHRILVELVGRVASSPPVEAAAAATALQVLFDSHVKKENELLLPLLAQSREVSLADLLGHMHEELSTVDAPEAAGGPAEHTCGCHEHDDELPELDARAVPHAIRHATIFGALDGVAPGSAMVLVAPHDPLPLLAQIETRDPGAFAVEYVERGPEAWRLKFSRALA